MTLSIGDPKSLIVQFDFYYDPNLVAPGKRVDQVIIKRNDGSEFRETVSTQRRQIYDPLGEKLPLRECISTPHRH